MKIPMHKLLRPMLTGFNRTYLKWTGIIYVTLIFSGCVYFNTYYNADKAYRQAMGLHDKRLDKNPGDSILSSPEEKLKLERCIAKSSKVLELYPEEKKYQPKALFLIGESYLAMGEYSKAILKYEELQRFYPAAQENQLAEYHRAKCLFFNGQYSFARTALEKVATSNPDPKIHTEVMIYLAQLEVKNNDSTAALNLYEKLLAEQAHTPESKGYVHYEAAKIAFGLKQWERARNHVLAIEIKLLPNQTRYKCEVISAECLYQLNRAQEGIAELEKMLNNRFYTTSYPEIDLKLATGYFLLGKPEKAIEYLQRVPKLAPKTAFAAEAFFRLGEYQLHDLKNEKQAKIFYDSAAVAGNQFAFGALGAERSAALSRLSEFRKSTDTAAVPVHYRDFMIAELFLFKLDNVDSALIHLDKIVQDKREDSTHSLRAAYARAFIQAEFKHSKPTADSLYQYVLQKYPNTEFAKQSERNLGMKPTVQTDEDAAHKLFLAAEELRFGGSPLTSAVIPAYTKVITAYAKTHEAAKAQFVIAMLFEQLSFSEEKVAGSRDSAITAFGNLRDQYPQTAYSQIALAKLDAAGIKPKPKNVPKTGTKGNTNVTGGTPSPSASNSNSTNPASPNSNPATPNSSTPNSPTPNSQNPYPNSPSRGNPSMGDGKNSDQMHHGGHYSGEGQPPPSVETTPAADTTSAPPEGKTKEEIDNGYENVEQY